LWHILHIDITILKCYKYATIVNNIVSNEGEMKQSIVGPWGFVIKRLRQNQQPRMSQEDLADLVGISRPLQSHVELGYIESFSEERLNKYAAAFKMTLAELNQELYRKTSSPRSDSAENKSELIEDESTVMVKLPLMGIIPAGAPEVEEDELQEVYISFPKILLRGASKKVYLLKIGGNSLIGDGINKGDIVAVDPEVPIIDGKIYAIRINGNEKVARHVTRLNGKVRLSSSDGEHKDIELDQIEILGRIIARANIKRL
jgi:repressor LexA